MADCSGLSVNSHSTVFTYVFDNVLMTLDPTISCKKRATKSYFPSSVLQLISQLFSSQRDVFCVMSSYRDGITIK